MPVQHFGKPVEVGRPDRVDAQTQFHALVLQVGGIGGDGQDAGRLRRRQVEDQVLDVFDVIGGFKCQAAVKEPGIDAELQLLGRFRFEIGIDAAGAHLPAERAADELRRQRFEDHAEIGQTARFPVGAAQLELVHEAHVPEVEIMQVDGQRKLRKSVELVGIHIQSRFVETDADGGGDAVLPVEV